MANQVSVAFVVNIFLPDDSAETLRVASEDIESAVSEDYVVSSVAPYQRESLEGDAQLDFNFDL